jgi:hypothetical protein
MNTRSKRIAYGTLLGLATVALAVADDIDLSWYTVDSGGDMWTTGGDVELSGTIGQHDASEFAMTGGELELVGGFWPGAAEEPFCFGDLNGDGEVNLPDLAQLLGSYGTTSGATYEDGDLDGDGDVELPDLAALLGVYGTICE